MDSVTDIYSTLREELAPSGAEVLTPDSAGYEENLKRWSEHCVKRASCVVKPTSPSDVSKILSFVRAHKIPFVVKGGGHSTSGSSAIEDGLVIDLGKLRKVTVDVEKKTITAEGGTIWEDVDVEAEKYGLATVGGTVNHTGVGGLTLGGGYGYLTGQYGLTIDNLLSVEIVLANGDIVTASSTENPDLFWAVRGAGQNFGVVTAFTFQGYEQKNEVFAGTLIFPPTALPAILTFAQKFHTTTTGTEALLFGWSRPPPAHQPILLTQIFHNGPATSGQAFFADLIALSPLVNTASSIPYSKLNSLLNPTAGFDGRKQFGGGAFRMPLSTDVVEGLRGEFETFVNEREGMGESMMLFEMIPNRKVREVGNGEMAFANRGDYYNVATLFKWHDPTLDAEIRTFSRNLLKRASKTAGGFDDSTTDIPPTTSPSHIDTPAYAEDAGKGVGVYGNYSETDVPASTIYGSNADRLRELKEKWDPGNLFDRGTRLVGRGVDVVN